jgi:hypothetical protein
VFGGEGEHLRDSTSKGLDRAVGFEDGAIVDDGAFCAILLVRETEGGGISQEEACQARVEWEDLAVLPEFHVTFGASLGSGWL